MTKMAIIGNINSKSQSFKGYEAFKLFRTLKLHFDGKLDATKLTCPIGNKKQYEACKTKYQFDKLASMYSEIEAQNLIIAHLLVKPNSWIGDLVKPESKTLYLKHVGRISNLTEFYKEDLKRILTHCKTKNIQYNDVFVCPERKMPDIINMLMDDVISLESFCILDSVMKITPFLNRDLNGDPIWDKIRDTSWRYRSLLDIDTNKMYQITKQLFAGQ